METTERIGVNKVSTNRRTSVVLVLLSAIMAAVALASTPASASSGGGCSSTSVQEGYPDANVQTQSCINYHPVAIIEYDAYVNFTATQPSGWSQCTVDISLYDETTHQYVDGQRIDCTNDARANSWHKHYGYSSAYPTAGHRYQTYVCVTATHAGRYIDGKYVFSPELTV
jgi:hypothetical protein